MAKAAFKTGDTLEYIGERKTWAEVEGRKVVPSLYKGLRVTVIETKEPVVGRGFLGYSYDKERIVDNGTDGCNVYEAANGFKKLIWPKNAREWRVIK
jgi:hypothetical protein